MAAPSRDGTNTNENQVTITWTALSTPLDGDSDVTSYHLMWDQGTLGVTWYNLLGITPQTVLMSMTLTNGVTAGDYF